jgi:hypothetical protein
MSSGEAGPLRTSSLLDSSKFRAVIEVPVVVTSTDSRQAKTQPENIEGALEAKNKAADSRAPMLLS